MFGFSGRKTVARPMGLVVSSGFFWGIYCWHHTSCKALSLKTQKCLIHTTLVLPPIIVAQTVVRETEQYSAAIGEAQPVHLLLVRTTNAGQDAELD